MPDWDVNHDFQVSRVSEFSKLFSEPLTRLTPAQTGLDKALPEAFLGIVFLVVTERLMCIQTCPTCGCAADASVRKG